MRKRRKSAGQRNAMFILDGREVFTDESIRVTGNIVCAGADCEGGRYIVVYGGASAAPLGYLYYATRMDEETFGRMISGDADLRSTGLSGTHWIVSCPCDSTGPESYSVRQISGIPEEFLPDGELSYAPASKDGRKGHLRCLAGTAVAAVLAAGYIGGTAYFSSHFLPNTSVNGTDVSFMTSKEACAGIRSACASTKISVSFRGGERDVFYGRDVSLSVPDAERKTGALLAEQAASAWKWPASLFSSASYILRGGYSADGFLLLGLMRSMDGMDPENMVPPEDAYIDRAPEGDGFVIVPEKEGNSVRLAPAVLEVSRRIRAGLFNTDLSLVPGAYTAPSVRSGSPDLAKELEELNSAVSGQITYLLPDGNSLVLDGGILSEWVSVSDDGEFYLDEDTWYENASAFVDELAASCNSVWEEREFDSTDSGLVTVRGGTYGYIVDKDSEIEAVCSLMYDPVEEERNPYYSQEESADRSNHGFGGTYVEVSIADQHLWYYEDGELVLDSPVVTGTRGSHDTPRGQFFVQFTQRNAVLVGRPDADGNPSYRTPVSYWMPFYNGCGMHDANWRSSFGGGIYTYSGSHGCVNMPSGAAGELFRHVEKGVPVIVY